MKSICLFSAYLKEKTISSPIRAYLRELSHHFDKVLFLYTNKRLSKIVSKELCEMGIECEYLKNKGYDFGMYQRVLPKIDLSYDTIGLINDSCYLCGSLDNYFRWFNQSRLQMAGMVDSNEIKYHLQSYFLLFQGGGGDLLKEYLSEKKIRNSKRKVIEHFEIGLSRHFIDQGLDIGAFLPFAKLNPNDSRNPSFFKLDELLNEGLPILKKKWIDGLPSEHLKAIGMDDYTTSKYSHLIINY